MPHRSTTTESQREAPEKEGAAPADGKEGEALRWFHGGNDGILEKDSSKMHCKIIDD